MTRSKKFSKFEALPEATMQTMVKEMHELMARYFPDSVYNGIAGLTFCLTSLIDLYISEGVFTEGARELFASALLINLKKKPKHKRCRDYE